MNLPLVFVVLASLAIAPADEPRLPGAVVECPAWLKKDAPFDMEAFFAMPPAEQNAAPLYLDALAEFGGEIWRDLPPDRKARLAEAKGRGQRIRDFFTVLLEDPKSLDRAAADALVDDLREPLRKVELAQLRPSCVFATGITIESFIPHVADARQVVRSVHLRSIRDLDRGEIDRPIRDVGMALRLSRDLRPRGATMCGIFSVAMDALVCLQIIPAILEHPKLRADQCDRMLTLLKMHEASALPAFSTGVKGEYVMLRTVLRPFQDGIAVEAGDDGRLIDRKLDRLGRAKNLIHLWKNVGDIQQLSNAEFTPLNYDDPDLPPRVAAFLDKRTGRWGDERAALDDCARTLTSSDLLNYTDRTRAIKALAEKHLGGDLPQSLFLTKFLLPNYENTALHVGRGETYPRSAQCLIAIRRWQITHNGANPPDLASACREAKLSAVPLDPFAEVAPLQMTTVDGRLVVYSIGPDGVDDQGLIDADLGRKPKGDFLFRLPALR